MVLSLYHDTIFIFDFFGKTSQQCIFYLFCLQIELELVELNIVNCKSWTKMWKVDDSNIFHIFIDISAVLISVKVINM